MTQQVCICASAMTLKHVLKRQCVTYLGLTRTDVCGPAALDSSANLPKLPVDEKMAYLSKRRVAAGGARPESDAFEDEEPQADDACKEAWQATLPSCRSPTTPCRHTWCWTL